MEKRQRTEEEKLAIVMQGLRERRSAYDMAREHDISPAVYYRWRNRFFEAGKKAFIPDVSPKSGLPWKRRYKRVDARVQARIELTAARQKTRILNLLTENICAGGAYFHTAQPLPENTKVKLDIVLPLDRINESGGTDQVLVKVQGTVCRSNETGMAIIFREGYRVYRLKK
jgi:transposase